MAYQLIGHFVGQARRCGASWSAIGEAMGVSKQAAQKRFVPSQPGLDLPDGSLTRSHPGLAPRARREARAMSRRRVRTEHLLLGLLSDPEGLAALTITALGATPEQIRSRAGAGPVPGPTAVPGQVPFTPRANKAIQLSLREAMGLGHNHIGTEHVLLGILAEGKDTEAKILAALGITEEGARNWIRQASDEMAAARPREQ